MGLGGALQRRSVGDVPWATLCGLRFTSSLRGRHSVSGRSIAVYPIAPGCAVRILIRVLAQKVRLCSFKVATDAKSSVVHIAERAPAVEDAASESVMPVRTHGPLFRRGAEGRLALHNRTFRSRENAEVAQPNFSQREKPGVAMREAGWQREKPVAAAREARCRRMDRCGCSRRYGRAKTRRRRHCQTGSGG